MKSNKIKVDDMVEIINPEIFVRCGYPMSLQETKNEIIKDHRKEIENFIDSIPDCSYWIKGPNYKAIEEIARALAYARIRTLKFGGSERTIHTEHDSIFKGYRDRVREIVRKITGTYHPANIYSYDEDSWKPAYLEDQKVHRILVLYGGIMIEDCHVKKYSYCEMKDKE